MRRREFIALMGARASIGVRYSGAGAGPDLSSGLLVVEFRAAMIPHTRLF